MIRSPHKFHIPVMGTGHSLDTPIRVAHFGINSVISLVDDLLCERIRAHYAKEFNLPYKSIPRNAPDGRALRIEAYLNLVHDVVEIKFNHLKTLALSPHNDKGKYFRLLPDNSPLKQKYVQWLHLPEGQAKTHLEKVLTDSMIKGSIDVNIMVKLDRINYTAQGEPLSEEFSDAKSALRGYARSKLHSSIVLSAGINQTLFTYMGEFKDFYRIDNVEAPKKIILKVSDFRSSLTQGRYLARKGLEVYEFRIESGLNCGGHAFPSQGYLLPVLLTEFTERRQELVDTLKPLIVKYYQKNNLEYPQSALGEPPLITVQGGIGHFGEAQRLYEDFGMDMTGWATPFLLVPEATCIDDATLKVLIEAKEADCYLSDVSPLGVPFNNVRQTGSEKWTLDRIENGTPGSPCPKKFLVSNTEFSHLPICVASSEYQEQKIKSIEQSDLPENKKKEILDLTYKKTCICDHLGNGALIKLGIVPETKAPQAICPGPNIAWFNRLYSLEEMIDHIYGRIEPLVPNERPHMFSKEIQMYVEYFKKLLHKSSPETDLEHMDAFYLNLKAGIKLCQDIANSKAYPYENLESLKRDSKLYMEYLDKYFQDWLVHQPV